MHNIEIEYSEEKMKGIGFTEANTKLIYRVQETRIRKVLKKTMQSD